MGSIEEQFVSYWLASLGWHKTYAPRLHQQLAVFFYTFQQHRMPPDARGHGRLELQTLVSLCQISHSELILFKVGLIWFSWFAPQLPAPCKTYAMQSYNCTSAIFGCATTVSLLVLAQSMSISSKDGEAIPATVMPSGRPVRKRVRKKMVLPLLKCHISIYEHPFWSPNELAKCQRGSTMTLNRSGDD